MEWARQVARMGKRIVVYRVLVRKHQEKRPHGKSRCRWEYNMKTDFGF
jgi:hypothetical protein